MPPHSSPALGELLAQVYANANAYHNNLQLETELFHNHVFAVIERQQIRITEPAALVLVRQMHTDDLYLTLACSQSLEAAWNRLSELYTGYLQKLALRTCGNHHQATEMAQDTLAHLFLEDRTGKKRIASYQGLSPLSNWLAVVMQNRAIEEWKASANQFETLDLIADQPDEFSIRRIEGITRCNTYRQMAGDSLQRACQVLSERDRWFLTLRYEEELKVKELAKMVKLDPTTVAYHIQRAREKLRKEVCSILKKEYKLNELALKECIEEILTNPAYSLLNLLKAA